jgi:HIV Tat-specific factor 1
MEQRQEAGGASFPTHPEEFDSDDRISFSKLDNKFLLVQEDGSEFEFDDAIKRWIPVVDEALLEEQQKAYLVSGVDETEPVGLVKRKRKKEYVNGEDVSPLSTSNPQGSLPKGRRTSYQSTQEIQGSSPTSRKHCSLRNRSSS